MSTNKTILGVIVFTLLIACITHEEDKLMLKRIELKKNFIIDTIAKYHNDSVLLININEFYGPYGDFTTYCGFIRNFGSRSVIYKAENLVPFKKSLEYIAQIKSEYFGKKNWGWYNIDENGDNTTLPNENKILDSLKAIYGVSSDTETGYMISNDTNLNQELEIIQNENKEIDSAMQSQLPDYFITSSNNGFFFIKRNGKIIQKYNYGNIVLSDTIDFESLDLGLYKIVGSRLQLISKNPDEISSMAKGIYYIPQPGIGVVRKYRISDINSVLMSYSDISVCPSKFDVDAP